MFLFASLQTEPAVQQGRELEELLLQVAAGDRDALGALYHRTRAAVYGLAHALAREHLQPSSPLPQCRETVREWRGYGGKPGKTRG